MDHFGFYKTLTFFETQILLFKGVVRLHDLPKTIMSVRDLSS